MTSRDVSVRPLTIRGEVVSQWDAYLPARRTYPAQTTWPGKGDGRAQGYAFLVGLAVFLVMIVGSVVAGLIGLLT